ncbi:cytochrome P450 [Coniochaeta sp. 2T2.1]|nr:cytochrome P450 [Coniochaeta sp. 2T2.1]
MLSHLTTPVKAVYEAYPFLTQLLVATSLCLITTFLILHEIFKPVGKKRLQTGQRPRLPPGPQGTPVWGNYELFRKAQLDRDNAIVLPIAPFVLYCTHILTVMQFKRLASEYGEMTTLHIGQKTFVFLNTNRVVTELISKRSRLTSSRSPYPISSDLVSHGARSLLQPEEEWWPRRKIQNSLLGNLKQYSAVQELESAQMLAEYVFKPEGWYKHHFRFANSVIHRIALGERPNKSREELEELQAVVHGYIGSLHVGSTYVDWFPSLATLLPKSLHSLWERGRYKHLRDWNHAVFHAWYDPVRDSVRTGTAPPSFVRDTLLHPDGKFSGTDDDACYIAMQLIEGGSDTTTSALRNLVRAAVEQPAPFRRAREEIDRVCGTGEETRLPTLDDMDSLRYICALVKEVLRWKPIFVSFPEHASTADIEFEGYLFPQGVSFVPNGAAVCAECEEPDEFRPERWLDGHETDVTHGLWQFGGGKRICVGYRLAQRSLFLAAARLVWGVDFERREGDEAMKYGLKHHAGIDEPFPVKATIRGEEYRKLILEEAERLGVLEDAKG